MVSKESANKISFFSKNEIKCSACKTVFKREELQTGRGRINAGELTEELRRLYIPTQKYGIVNPLLYPILVCPNCFFAGFASDFTKTDPDMIKHIIVEEKNRQQLVTKLLGIRPDFTEFRTLFTGFASYLLAFASTVHLPKSSSPTARRGLFSLRAAWLAGDLYKKTNVQHFELLQEELYYQAYQNYDLALERQIKNIEPLEGFAWMGPDVDTNFGYDGFLYIVAYLHFKYLYKFDREEKVLKLGQIKRVLSKIFGMGKSTRDKPEVLVSSAKALYTKANDLLKELEDSGLDISAADEIEKAEE